MCDKYSKTIIKTLKENKVYIVKYIAKSFSEFVLIFAVHTSHSKIVFSITVLNVSSYVQTYKHNFMTDFLDVDIVLLNEKIKIYRLYHQQFIYFDFIKLCDLHKMTILEKSILIVENNKNMCEIYVLIKFINK